MAIKQLGKYDIIERLGRGGMAEVYKAYQASLDRYVAIKLLHPFLADDPEFKDRFEREARNVARLRHPNIVQVYDFEYDQASESYYMVMELIDGQTLKDYLSDLTTRGQKLDQDEIHRIIRGAGEALAYAHARGMIHRDVKPANLMMDSDGRIVLTDFGIAKIVTGIQFTASGGMVGTPAYMAPEQGLGEQGDERSDLYSLGVILYQLCTGQLPYDGETPLSVILKHLNEPIPSVREKNPEILPALEHIIQKAMAKDPDERYQNAEEMLRELGGGEAILTTPPKPPTAEVPAVSAVVPPAEPPLPTELAVAASAKRSTAEVPAVGAATPPAPPPVARRTSWGGIGAFIVIGGLLLLGAFALGGGKLPLIGFNPSSTPTASASPTSTQTASPTQTYTASPTSTFTASPTQTASATATYTPSNTATFTPSPTATFTASPTFTPTFTGTFTPSPTATFTTTHTPTFTPTSTPSVTPTATYTPSLTLTPTVNITATLQAATNAAVNLTSTSVYATIDAIGKTQIAQNTPTPNYTATALKCKPQYFVVQSKTPDKDPIRANTDFERTIILRNTGDCDWLPGTYLQYSSGESFGASIKIIMENQQPVPPNSEAQFVFKGHTPRKGGLYTGNWEVRLYPDNKLIEPLLPISFFAYE